MRRLFALAAAGTLTACAAAAPDSHDHSAQASQPPAMHEHMKMMKEQIAQMRAARDPKERERLMNEHMKTMEESMAKMQRMMMGCGKM